MGTAENSKSEAAIAYRMGRLVGATDHLAITLKAVGVSMGGGFDPALQETKAKTAELKQTRQPSARAKLLREIQGIRSRRFPKT